MITIKNVFFSKQGVLFRIIYLLFNMTIFLPVSISISFVLRFVIKDNGLLYYRLAFWLCFALINMAWIIRNSLIVFRDNKLIIRDIIGKKIVFDISLATKPTIITSKEYSKMLNARTGLQSIKSNCFYLLSKKIKLIHFKDNLGRDVVIGAFAIEKLNELLQSVPSVKKAEPISDISPDARKGMVDQYYIKMPLINHITMYFMHWGNTVFLPAFIVSFYGCSLYISKIKINIFVYIVSFIIISLFYYSRIIRITVDRYNKIIRMRIFKDNDKNLINMETISHLAYNEADNYTKESSKLVISTPGYSNLNSDKIHIITAYCDAELAVNNSRNLYDDLSELKNSLG